MRILIVEDDRTIGSFIEKGLIEAGYAVDRVGNGESGLYMMAINPYDVAIIDVMPPAMNGLTLIDKVRLQGNNTPVLILSARKSIDDRIIGLQKGGDDYLTKPFSFAELLARVQALIRRSAIKSDASTSLKTADLTLNLLTRQVHRAQVSIELNAREFSLLEYLMRNEGVVLSKNNDTRACVGLPLRSTDKYCRCIDPSSEKQNRQGVPHKTHTHGPWGWIFPPAIKKILRQLSVKIAGNIIRNDYSNLSSFICLCLFLVSLCSAEGNIR